MNLGIYKSLIWALIFFIIFVIIQDLFYNTPYLLFFLLLVLSIIIIKYFYSIRNLILFLSMGIIGPISEISFIKAGVLVYHIFENPNIPNLFGLPIWISFSWGIAGVLIYEISTKIISYTHKYRLNEKSKGFLIFSKFLSVIILLILIPLSFSLTENSSTATLIIFIGFLFFEYLKRNIDDGIFFIIGVIVGVLAEGSLLQTGIYEYIGITLFNISLWMVLLWGIAGIIIYRFVKTIDYFFASRKKARNNSLKKIQKKLKKSR